ncbi:Sas10/Utp3/C1D family-domain-containing protein [Aspergillus crustosus]
MESANLISLLERLDDNVDDLEEVLAPILENTFVDNSKKLPVLDKAKFHVLITYTLESLIYSYLRLRGVEAKEHPVFRELTRVKQYNEKIKLLEAGPEKRSMRLDKQAAGRFIKHGLAGNEKNDLQREEQLAKEKARAQLMASRLAKEASATPQALNQLVSSDSRFDNDYNPTHDPEGGAEEAEPILRPKITGKPRKSKKDKEKSSDSKGIKHKNCRSKEERRERRQERRKRKEESRNARKTT